MRPVLRLLVVAFAFALLGVGAPSAFAAGPAWTVSGKTDLGPVAPYDTATSVLTLTSTGDSPLVIDSVDIAHLENNRTRYFSIASTDCQQRTLSIGEQCHITVSYWGVFAWADAGYSPSAYNIVEVWSNAPLPLPRHVCDQWFNYDCVGPGFDITALVMDGWVDVTPATLTFEPTPIGGTSAPQSLHVTNTSPVNVSGLYSDWWVWQSSWPPQPPGPFHVVPASSTCASPLAPGASCDLSVVFTPTTWGSKNDQLRVHWNTYPLAPGPNSPPHIYPPLYIPVSGTGVDITAPVITPSLAGTLGNDGWYTSAVAVSWTLTDDESGIATSAGCGPTTITSDTAGTTVTCAATNNQGLLSIQSVTLKIDKTPPVTTCAANPAALSPANDKLVPVSTSVRVSDALSGPAGFLLQSITTTGSLAQDVSGWTIGTADTNGLLRASKEKKGHSSSYTLTYAGHDQAGNSSTCAVVVQVAKT